MGIENPNFYDDQTPFASATPIKALALEIWTMSDDIYFDNFYLGNSILEADALKAATFDKKEQQAKLNEPPMAEKVKGWFAENTWAAYVFSAIAGIPLLYFIYKKTLGAGGASEEEEEPVEEPEYEKGDEPTEQPEDEEEEEEEEKEDEEADD